MQKHNVEATIERAEARRNHVPPALGAVVGTQPFTPEQLFLRIFSYVRRNGLLGEKARVHVERDANLKTLFPAPQRVFFDDLVRRVGEMLRCPDGG
jgi:chromatin remodeling complex protein RSC6